tara:strand:+ start:2517 stop:2771 length:255 start_codon:yes stop_codon:yes gene_type:complete
MDKKKTANIDLYLKALDKLKQVKGEVMANGPMTAEGRLKILAAETEARRILDPSTPVEVKPKQTRKPPVKKKAAPKAKAAAKDE